MKRQVGTTLTPGAPSARTAIDSIRHVGRYSATGVGLYRARLTPHAIGVPTHTM